MKEGGRKKRVRGKYDYRRGIREMQVASFEDGGMGPWVKEGEWPLKGDKDNNTRSPLNPPEGTQYCCHLDMSPVRLISDYWPTEL